MITKTRFLFIFFLFLALFNSGVSQTIEKKVKTSDLPDKYKGLYEEGYTGSLLAAQEVISDDTNAIQYLELLLKDKSIKPHEFAMFPFNIFWALSRIGGIKAEKLIVEYNYLDKETSDWSLKALKLKEKYSNRNDVGVFWQMKQDLYEKPVESSKIIGFIKGGAPLKVISRQSNPNETGPRGGDQEYLFIENLETHVKGYLQLLGFGFDPYL